MTICAIAVVLSLILPGIATSAGDNGNDEGQLEVAQTTGYPGRTLGPWYWTGGNYQIYENMGNYDANGTLVQNFSGTPIYNPYLIGRLATEIYTHWYNVNDSVPLNKFRNQIAWMRANEKIFGDHSLWFYNITLNARQTDPWWSAFANAWIIASLLDSYALDHNPIDLEIAWRGLKSFNYFMQDHGVTTNWNGTVWYEEEATNNTLVVQQPSHILNGMIEALSIGQYMYEFNLSAVAKSLFDNGFVSLNAHVKEFDLGMWWKYSMINIRAAPSYTALHTFLFQEMTTITNDPSMQSWWKRSDWMRRLPSIGYTPANVTASSTIDPINYGTDRTFDKQLTLFVNNRYWVGYLPATLIVDFGSSKPMNFIGYFGNNQKVSPKNWTLHTSIDGTNWVLRGSVFNSNDTDKCIMFDDSIQARYVKFTIICNNINSDRVALDEIIVANLTAEDLYEARVSIEDHRFINVDGRLAGSVPAGTIIEIDGDLKTNDSAQNYLFYLPDGSHNLSLRYNGTWINRSMHVRFAQIVYFNATAQMFIDDTPIARAGQNRTAVWNAVITFDGSASYDNQEVSNYTWTISDGTSLSKYGPIVTHRFQQLGNHAVSLLIKDPGGNQAIDTIWVSVVPDEPPVAKALLDQVIDEGEKIRLDASLSTDDVGIVKYTWSIIKLDVTLFGEQVEFCIMRPGTYYITLTVEDTNGSESITHSILTVLDITPPIADAGTNRTVIEGERVTFNGSLSSDNAGINNFTWNFTYNGKGVTLYGQVPSFYFNVTGHYNVTLTVRDTSNLTDNETVQIIVEDGGVSPGSSIDYWIVLAVPVIIAESIAIIYLILRMRKHP